MTSTTTTTKALLDFSPRWNRDGEIDRWVARPIGPGTLFDRTYGQPVRSGGFTCAIHVEGGDNAPLRFWLVTQGKEPGGRRYRECWSFEEAITRAEQWAARRIFFSGTPIAG